MDHTFESLTNNTDAELHEIAAGLDAGKVKGHESLEKDELVKLLCTALGIEAGDSKAAEADAEPKTPKVDAKADAKAGEKAKIKAQIQALKKKRAEAIEAHDEKQLKWTRLNIRRLKQKVRRASA